MCVSTTLSDGDRDLSFGVRASELTGLSLSRAPVEASATTLWWEVERSESSCKV